MILRLRHALGWIVNTFGSPQDMILENLALRQQLLALHSKRPRRRLSAWQTRFGSCCEAFGPGGRGLSSWSRPERLSAGIARAFGCTGSGFQEPDAWEAEGG